jgi:hypothetical protein
MHEQVQYKKHEARKDRIWKMTLTDFRHKGSVHRGFQNDWQQKHRSLRIKYLIVFITHDSRLPIIFFQLN